jgi:hypothetical protein
MAHYALLSLFGSESRGSVATPYGFTEIVGRILHLIRPICPGLRCNGLVRTMNSESLVRVPVGEMGPSTVGDWAAACAAGNLSHFEFWDARETGYPAVFAKIVRPSEGKPPLFPTQVMDHEIVLAISLDAQKSAARILADRGPQLAWTSGAFYGFLEPKVPWRDESGEETLRDRLVEFGGRDVPGRVYRGQTYRMDEWVAGLFWANLLGRGHFRLGSPDGLRPDWTAKKIALAGDLWWIELAADPQRDSRFRARMLPYLNVIPPRQEYRNGVVRGRHANGRMKGEAPVPGAVYHGDVREWHDNGKLRRVTPYVRGYVHGRVRQWDSSGRLLGEYEMNMGRGTEREWNEDGSLLLERQIEEPAVPYEDYVYGRFAAWLTELGPSLPSDVYAMMMSVSGCGGNGKGATLHLTVGLSFNTLSHYESHPRSQRSSDLDARWNPAFWLWKPFVEVPGITEDHEPDAEDIAARPAGDGRRRDGRRSPAGDGCRRAAALAPVHRDLTPDASRFTNRLTGERMDLSRAAPLFIFADGQVGGPGAGPGSGARRVTAGLASGRRRGPCLRLSARRSRRTRSPACCAEPRRFGCSAAPPHQLPLPPRGRGPGG